MSTALVNLKRPSADRTNFDAKWVSAAKAGYILAFEELVTRNERRVYRFALNVTQNQSDAEDVLQSTFVKAYEHLHGFPASSRFSSWLLRIAANEALQKLREKYPEEVAHDQLPEADGTLVPHDLAAWSDNPAREYTKRELERILSEGINALKPISRVVFLLRDVEKCSVGEVADFLGLSMLAVKSRLLRARLETRGHLNYYFKRRDDPVPGRPTPLMEKEKESDNERPISSPAA
jgi:RNA polymerase sigma-70 factor (ECF subfamily)